MIPMDLIDAILVAKYFVKYVFKLYRLPNLIISNYKTIAFFLFTKEMQKYLNPL